MPRKLPKGVTPAIFAEAVAALEAVVGKEWVFTSDDDLETYRDAYSLRWDDPDEYLASAAVAPDSVDQVQAIVKIANKYKIPLYPISTGKNLTYGGPAPTYTGSVVLDLKRMNKIITVDDKRNFCLVEPGVSYFDLYRYIKDKGLKLWIDCPDPGWGSPIGNALEHGVGYTTTNHRDHFGSHCGMEVVTPTGDLMRTGRGALPNADSWQDYRYGVGPYIDGLFSQSNFGIVTKMGFWLYPMPETWLTGTVSVPRYADLGPLLENVSYLEDSQLMTGQPIYSSPVGAGGPDAEVQAMMARGWPSLEATEAYVKKRGVPAWRVKLQFYGPEATVQANWAYAQARIAKAIPGATFSDVEMLPMPLTPAQEKTHHLVNFGVPNMEIFAMISRKPSDPPNPPDGHSDILAVCPRTADAFFRGLKVLSETQRSMGVELVTTPFSRSPTNWFHRNIIFGPPTIVNFRDDREMNKKYRALFEAYIKNMAAAGYGLYRTNSGMQDLLVDQYSFGDHALRKFWEHLKDGIDPNGIVSPGRYGIWPKHLRQGRAGGSSAVKAKRAGKKPA